MTKIYIPADSFKHFEIPIAEYQKRLWKSCKIIKVKPVKNWNIIEKETEEIIKRLEKENWYKIVLNPKWESFSTEKLSELIENKKQNHPNIIFLIWWANGLDYEKLKPHIDLELNLWELTMPHALALLVILEQIYRLEMIKKWSNYHK